MGTCWKMSKAQQNGTSASGTPESGGTGDRGGGGEKEVVCYCGQGFTGPRCNERLRSV